MSMENANFEKVFLKIGKAHVRCGEGERDFFRRNHSGSTITMGEGSITGCTRNNDGESSVPVYVFLEEIDTEEVTRMLITTPTDMDEVMKPVIRWVQDCANNLKKHYGASKVEMRYFWRG